VFCELALVPEGRRTPLVRALEHGRVAVLIVRNCSATLQANLYGPVGADSVNRVLDKDRRLAELEHASARWSVR